MHNDIMRESHEQRLVTKEHLATYTHLNYMFKPALCSSALVIKLLNVVESCFNPKVFVSKSSFKHLASCPLLKSKVFYLVSNVQLVKRFLL